MTTLEAIITHGNRPNHAGIMAGTRMGENKITCADGFRVSVIAGPGAYCNPRPAFADYAARLLPNEVDPGYAGPYDRVEVGFPSQRPEPWQEWQEHCDGDDEDPTDSLYGYVPVDLVRRLIEAHGGEK